MAGFWRASCVAFLLAIFTSSRGNLPVLGELDVPRGKSSTFSVASESGVKACEAAFDSPPEGQIVFRSLSSGSLFPPSGFAICKLDRDGYRVLSMSVTDKAGSRNSRPLETQLALRVLALFHSELERPRDRKPSALVVDVDTVTWVETRPGLPKQTGETFDCVDRNTRLGRMIELVTALCRFSDCPPDELVRGTNQLDQIATELEIALKLEALSAK
jgi:hypothetical protein